jgi:hypothetical protein
MSSKDNHKQFLLCLGTQKAGTSWFFDFLSNVDGVNMGFVKELHVFDHLEFGEFFDIDCQSLHNISQNRIKPSPKTANIYRRLLMMSDNKEYFKYFQELLSIPGSVITGDFTPEYCLLPEEKLRYIKSSFEEKGIIVKAIFLMRDPVERIWSATRMTNRIHRTNTSLLEVYKSKYIEMLTRYEVLVPKIASVFNNENLYINFYENFFQQKTIDEITDFLSLPRQNPDFNKLINASTYKEILPEHRLIVENYYYKTYEYMSKANKQNSSRTR